MIFYGTMTFLTLALIVFVLYIALFLEKKTGDDPCATPTGGTYEYKVQYHRTEDTKESDTSISVPVAVPSEGSFTIYRPKLGDKWPSGNPYATKLNNEEFRAAVEYSEEENKKESLSGGAGIPGSGEVPVTIEYYGPKKKKTASKKKKKKTKGKRK